MQLSEKILSFFPGLRSLSANDSAPTVESSTSVKDGISLFDQIQSQVQTEASTTQSTTNRQSTLDIATNPALYSVGVPVDGGLMMVGQSMTVSSAALQEVGTEYASMSESHMSEFVDAEFETADCARSMTALGSFTTELRHVVPFQTIAVTPPTKNDAGVVVSIPTDELTQDSMEALAKLLEKYGVATTGFMRESESEVRPMES